ncbi:MAG: SbcC/MukB-like Walker B domain-containing protein, partial [Verrucomicrobiota bacterium]
TIPQFAAAAAHYRSASPLAPRLIMLDEAFVGIDSATRAKLMGLLETFDLDLVMTSEREWGCYPTVSGLAIYQLSSHPNIDAVGVTRWVWNGQNREQVAQPDPMPTNTQKLDESQEEQDLLINLTDA